MYTPVPWCLKAMTCPQRFTLCQAVLIYTNFYISGYQHPSFACTFASEYALPSSHFWKHTVKHISPIAWAAEISTSDNSLLDNFRGGMKVVILQKKPGLHRIYYLSIHRMLCKLLNTINSMTWVLNSRSLHFDRQNNSTFFISGFLNLGATDTSDEIIFVMEWGAILCSKFPFTFFRMPLFQAHLFPKRAVDFLISQCLLLA